MKWLGFTAEIDVQEGAEVAKLEEWGAEAGIIDGVEGAEAGINWCVEGAGFAQ